MAPISPSYLLSQLQLPYDDLESGQGPMPADPAQQIQDRMNALRIIAAALGRDRALDAGDEIPDTLNTNSILPGGPMFFPRFVKNTNKAYEDFAAAVRAGDLLAAIPLQAKMNVARDAQGLPPVPPIQSYFDVLKNDKHSALGFTARWLQSLVDAGKAVNFWADPVGEMARVDAIQPSGGSGGPALSGVSPTPRQ
jgi:hypothetical protein